MAEETCPDCGKRMGNGYQAGDQCSDCYETDEAANEIIRKFEAMPMTFSFHIATRMKDIIRAEIKERFA